MWKLEAFYRSGKLLEFLNENNIKPSDAKITYDPEYREYVLFYYVYVKNDEKIASLFENSYICIR